VYLFGRRSREALDFGDAHGGRLNIKPARMVDLQLILNLEAAIARMQKNCSS